MVNRYRHSGQLSRRTGIPLLLSASLWSCGSHADEPDLFELPLSNLLQIEISSASLFPEKTEQAAASVTKIEREDWELWGARRNLDALSGEAGISVNPSIGGGLALSVRGYTQLLSVRGILTLIDGVPVNDMLFGSGQYENEHITPGVLDNIELIRGPGSTLYGTDAFHGVLSLNTFNSNRDETQASIKVGSQDYTEGQIRTSGGKNGHYLNIAVDARQQMHWGQDYINLNTGQKDQRDQQFKAGSAVVKLHDDGSSATHYLLGAYYNKIQYDEGLGGGPNLGYFDRDIAYTDNQFGMLQAKLSWDLNDQTEYGLASAFWTLDRNSIQNVRTGIRGLNHDINRWQQSAFIRWQDPRGNRLYSALEYSNQAIDRATNVGYDINYQKLDVQTTPQQGLERQITSLVTQGRWQTPWQPLAVEAGIRLDDYSDAGFQPSPRVGFIYEMMPRHTLKLLYGEAFRAAVAQELAGSFTFRGNPNLDPEQISSTELIYVYSGPQSQLQVTLFESRWDDGIVSVALYNDPMYIGTYVNDASNSSHGVEVSFLHEQGPWQWQASSSWVSSESNNDNMEYSAFPEWMLKAEARYQLSARSSLGVRADILGSRTEGPYSAGFPNPAELPTYIRWDLAYRHKLSKQLELTTTVRNLLDHNNRLASLVNSPNGDEDYPRTLEVGISAQW